MTQFSMLTTRIAPICTSMSGSMSAVPPTLQSLHPVQLGEQLVDHAVGDPGAVVAPPGRQRLELVEEEDAGLGGLGPEAQREVGHAVQTVTSLKPNIRSPPEDVSHPLLARSDVLAQKFRPLPGPEHPFGSLSKSTTRSLLRFCSVRETVPTLTLMKFMPLSLATARASRVFPVPGAPNSRIPERCRIGRLEKRTGY